MMMKNKMTKKKREHRKKKREHRKKKRRSRKNRRIQSLSPKMNNQVSSNPSLLSRNELYFYF